VEVKAGRLTDSMNNSLQLRNNDSIRNGIVPKDFPKINLNVEFHVTSVNSTDCEQFRKFAVLEFMRGV
jgi:hypothetical protein